MPNKTIYIRKEDEELWRKLPNKADAISKMLRGEKLSGVTVQEKVEAMIKDIPKPRQTNQSNKVMAHLDNIFADEATPEKAEYTPQELKCCKLPNPCKHWVYDGGTGVWTNLITKERKEVL